MLIVIIAFGALVFIHEFAHFLVAKRIGVRVEIFSLGFGFKIFSWKRKETEYRISAVPLGGYVKLAGDDPRQARKGAKDEFLSQPAGKRALIVSAGPLGNYLLGFLIFAFLFLVGFPTLGTKVGDILEGYPAEKYGIMPGDEILAINGRKVSTWEELTEIIHPLPDKVIEIELRQQDKIIRLKLRTSGKEIVDLWGRRKKIGLIGITPDYQNIINIHYSPWAAFFKAGRRVLEITKVTLLALANILVGKLSLKESVSGPIGIFYLSSQAVKLGFFYFLSLMAVISTSLAIFNLLPIPVLDGGHLLFLSLEKIRKRPLSAKVQERITQISLALLLILIIFVTYFDFLKFMTK